MTIIELVVIAWAANVLGFTATLALAACVTGRFSDFEVLLAVMWPVSVPALLLTWWLHRPVELPRARVHRG